MAKMVLKHVERIEIIDRRLKTETSSHSSKFNAPLIGVEN